MENFKWMDLEKQSPERFIVGPKKTCWCLHVCNFDLDQIEKAMVK